MAPSRGKTSALCRNGPENALSTSRTSPLPRAMEPVRLDVSTARIRSVCGIFDPGTAIGGPWGILSQAPEAGKFSLEKRPILGYSTVS